MDVRLAGMVAGADRGVARVVTIRALRGCATNGVRGRHRPPAALATATATATLEPAQRPKPPPAGAIRGQDVQGMLTSRSLARAPSFRA